MPERAYPLREGGPSRIFITWKRGFRDGYVLLDGHQLGTFSNLKTLKQGLSFPLPDSSKLWVQMHQSFGIAELEVSRNGIPLPNSDNHPLKRMQTAGNVLIFVAVMTIIAVLISPEGKSSWQDLMTFAPVIVTGAAYGVLAYFVRQRHSLIALGLATAGYLIDTVTWALFLLTEMTPTSSGAIGGLVGGGFVRIYFILVLVKGIWGGLTRLKNTTKQKKSPKLAKPHVADTDTLLDEILAAPLPGSRPAVQTKTTAASKSRQKSNPWSPVEIALAATLGVLVVGLVVLVIVTTTSHDTAHEIVLPTVAVLEVTPTRPPYHTRGDDSARVTLQMPISGTPAYQLPLTWTLTPEIGNLPEDEVNTKAVENFSWLTNVAANKPVIDLHGGLSAYANTNPGTTTQEYGQDSQKWYNKTNEGEGSYQIIDLGQQYSLAAVGYTLDWDGEHRNSLTLRVEVSNDCTTWTVVSELVHPYDGQWSNYVDANYVIDPIQARYVKYWEPPDGEWNGWGTFSQLRAFVEQTTLRQAAVPTLTDGVSPDESTPIMNATSIPANNNHPIVLDGALTQVIYEGGDFAYGLDASNRQIVVLNLKTLQIDGRIPLPNTPSRACFDSARNALFVTNRGNKFITQVDLQTRQIEIQIPWPAHGADVNWDEWHYHIKCLPDQLILTDGSGIPLPVILDLTKPDHAAHGFYTGPFVTRETTNPPGSGIGDWVFTADGQQYYYWYQFGWKQGRASSTILRAEISEDKIIPLDEYSPNDYTVLARTPLDTPIFLDEASGRLIVKRLLLNANNLKEIYFSFDEGEEIYAVDWEHNLAASKHNIYDLGFHYRPTTLPMSANLLFFDDKGMLWVAVFKQEQNLYILGPIGK